MKILMLTPYLPYPLLSGGQTRSYNLLKNLAKNHDITLFSVIRSENENQYEKELLKFCKKVKFFHRRPAWSFINIFLAGITLYPFLVSIYLSQSIRKALEYELKHGVYDLIHAETFYVMPNIPQTSVPILLVEQTIEYRVYQHFIEVSAPFLLKPFLWIDVFKVKFWEKHFWKKAKRVIAMSEADREEMQKILPELDINIVPNGVDVESFSVSKRQSEKKQRVLYVGNFKWLQNREAVRILIREVWPQVKKKLPMTKLWIVGRGQLEEFKAIQDRDIILDESIDDIRDAYQEAEVLLAPIKGPGGTRLKILEAMASGCPVVTTPVGIEGIEARHGKEVLVGKTSDDLALWAIKVLKNKTFRKGLIYNAKLLVAKKYKWSSITKRLNKIYLDVGYDKSS